MASSHSKQAADTKLDMIEIPELRLESIPVAKTEEIKEFWAGIDRTNPNSAHVKVVYSQSFFASAKRNMDHLQKMIPPESQKEELSLLFRQSAASTPPSEVFYRKLAKVSQVSFADVFADKQLINGSVDHRARRKFYDLLSCSRVALNFLMIKLRQLNNSLFDVKQLGLTQLNNDIKTVLMQIPYEFNVSYNDDLSKNNATFFMDAIDRFLKEVPHVECKNTDLLARKIQTVCIPQLIIDFNKISNKLNLGKVLNYVQYKYYTSPEAFIFRDSPESEISPCSSTPSPRSLP